MYVRIPTQTSLADVNNNTMAFSGELVEQYYKEGS